MNRFVGLTLCFILSLFVCQQANGQDVNLEITPAIAQSDNFAIQYDGCDRGVCQRPLRTMARNTVIVTRNGICRTGRVVGNVVHRTRSATRRALCNSL